MAQVKLRKINLTDIETLQRLSQETFTDTYKAQNTPENLATYLASAYNLPKLKRELATPLAQFYFAYVDQQLAGYLKVNQGSAQTEDMGATTLEVERIYVRPAFKRHGLGSRFIKQACEVAEQLGKSKIWLGVWEHNLIAQQFYTKLGFVRTSQHTFWLGTDQQTDFIMEKALKPAENGPA
ncbi:GNAT family N-acetyltransferase [Loigolactobacillus iwatensis]|uniref:GNAT family N-acetyltransferase n=1 Tax=Loigolactobacillus iwatensis TaxID=1267156 RepID=UPI000F7E79B8|nr:GNAT family N-acetyltransferase [Loigolactobacillus iwatensis]